MTKRKERIKYKPIEATIPVSVPDLLEVANGEKWLADAIALVFHQMYMVRLSDWQLDVASRPRWYKDGQVSLCSKILKRLITGNYRTRVIDVMLNKGLIRERLNFNDGQSYITGVRCILFSIPAKYLISPKTKRHFRKHVVTSYKLLKNVNNVLNEHKNERDNWIASKGTHYVTLQDMTNGLTLNVAEAANYIKTLERKRGQLSNEDLGFRVLQLENASGKTPRFNVDNYGGRFYSPYTNLKRDLRQFFRFTNYSDEPHTILDFRCSQPLLTGYLLRYPVLLDKFLPEFSGLRQIIEYASDKDSTGKFLNLCCSGDLYLYWMYKRRLISGPKRKLSDDEKNIAKKDLFKILFGPQVAEGVFRREVTLLTKKPAEVFVREFPEVLLAVQSFKAYGVNDYPFLKHIYYDDYGRYKPEELRYKIVSYMLQKLEARIMLDVLTPRLIAKQITPFTTIHDAFWMPQSLVPRAQEEILSFFDELRMMRPSLSIDVLKGTTLVIEQPKHNKI